MLPARRTANRGWTATALDLLFPPVCTFCVRPLEPPLSDWFLCHGCYQSLTIGKTVRFCDGCGLVLPNRWADGTKCPSCPKRSAVDTVIPLGVYDGELRQAVIRAKRFQEYPLAATLGALLTEKLTAGRSSRAIEVAIPIPKFWTKRVVRGTNTAEVLSEPIARVLGVPVLPAALTCQRRTSKQSLLGRSDRQRNARGVFCVSNGYDFEDADVLIVDDIMTSGSTAQDAARALCRAGARRITVAVVARSTGQRTGLRSHSTATGGIFPADSN